MAIHWGTPDVSESAEVEGKTDGDGELGAGTDFFCSFRILMEVMAI